MQSAQQEVIDTEQLTTLASAAGIDAANAILEAFWKSTEELLNLLKESVKARNFEDISKAAHALKGSAINLGAVQLANRAKQIELAAKGQEFNGVLSGCKELGGDISSARQAFKVFMQSLAA